MITRQFGMEGLPPKSITLRLTGTAGQSLGAFIVPPIRIEVFGAANDYVGKGLSGGTIIIRPSSTFDSHKNVIIGNTALYGATGGTLFARGQAGRTVRGSEFWGDRGYRGVRLEWMRVYDGGRRL